MNQKLVKGGSTKNSKKQNQSNNTDADARTKKDAYEIRRFHFGGLKSSCKEEWGSGNELAVGGSVGTPEVKRIEEGGADSCVFAATEIGN